MLTDPSNENEWESIRFNYDCDSNSMDEIDAQSLKYPEQRISTLRGINIDVTDEL
jgi:hypothetical protein